MRFYVKRLRFDMNQLSISTDIMGITVEIDHNCVSGTITVMIRYLKTQYRNTLLITLHDGVNVIYSIVVK